MPAKEITMHATSKNARFVALSVTLLAIALSLSAVALAEQPWYLSGHNEQHPRPNRDASPLIEKVRKATARFRDINVALGEMWVRGTPCVSGPDAGAMGVHFILPSRVGDGVLNANEPEALIYEPMPGGAYRLVGVEFIVLADDWARLNPGGATPALDGHLTHLVEAPNRYGLPAFYELHVWAWENNPKGSFADWNTQVSCEKQSGE
jgi:hypothetical protein